MSAHRNNLSNPEPRALLHAGPREKEAGMRILIVDDVEANSAILKRLAMKVFGGEIVIANSGSSAVKCCHEEFFDLIITDFMMPDIDGLQMVNIIRGFTEYARVPVIMMSADHDPAILSRASKAGINDFLTKPINSEMFRKKIVHYLSMRPTPYAA